MVQTELCEKKSLFPFRKKKKFRINNPTIFQKYFERAKLTTLLFLGKFFTLLLKVDNKGKILRKKKPKKVNPSFNF
jgi:hypothetical protein